MRQALQFPEERGKKKRRKLSFKTLHEGKPFRNSCQELQHMPYQKHDTISKAFFSKGFAVGVPIAQDSYKSNPRRFDIKTLQEKNHFRMHAADTKSSYMCKTQGYRAVFPFVLPAQQSCQLHFRTLLFPTSNSRTCAQWGRKIKVSPFSGIGMGER